MNIKKIFINFVAIAVLVVPFAAALPVRAAAPNWDITGTWELALISTQYPSGNPYLHDMTVTGDTATGGTPAGGPYVNTWTANISISGDSVTIVAAYITGGTVTLPYSFTAIGTITPGAMSGTWSDTTGDSGTWTGTGTTTLLSAVTTNPAAGMGQTSATVDGTVGASGAADTSFWLGTTSAGPFTPSTNLLSELPVGWSSVDSSAQSANATFSYTYTGLTPGATYYFVAWALVGGTWYPGTVLNFSTASTLTPPPTAPDLVAPADGSIVTTNNPIFTWNPPMDVTAVTYEWESSLGPATNSDGAFAVQFADHAGLTVTNIDSPATPSGTYYWHVRATDAAGDISAWSDTWTVTIDTAGKLVVYKDTVGGDDTFALTGTNGVTTFPIIITTSGGIGSEEFDNLVPGSYTVTEPNILAGWQQADNDCNAVVVTAGETAICTVTNVKNETKGIDEIRGTTYEDRDGDGTLKDGDHHRLAGVTVYLDLNKNGNLDPGEPSTITDKYGDYHFSSLPTGTYVVRESVQLGWEETYPTNGSYTVTFTASGKISKKDDFGNFKFGSISGTEFSYSNGNDKKGSDKTVLSGWTIDLKGPNGLTKSTVTDSNGNYSFSSLGPGVYAVSEVVQSGWTQIMHPGPVRIQSGTASTRDNFGNIQKVTCGWNNGHGNNPDQGYFR